MLPVDYITVFSDSIIYLSILLVPMYLWGKNKKHLFLYCLSLSLVIISVYFLKIFINVPRPVNSLIPLPPTQSFPSMHASLGMIPAGFFFHDKKYRKTLVIYGILISYSRVVLGVHYWVDIFFGAAIGFILPILIRNKEIIFSLLNKK